MTAHGQSLSNGTEGRREKSETKPKREPRSLEELVQQRRAEQEASARPVFLTKEQRQQLSLQRDRKEVACREAPVRNDVVAPVSSTLPQSELNLIKKQYLGLTHDETQETTKKKKIMNPKDKRNKFKFEWDAEEDTSVGGRALMTEEVPLLFGRGFRGGIDRRMSSGAPADVHLSKKRKTSFPFLERPEVSIKGGHWSEKTREEMTERDWRIFKEDFNIAYKGVGNTILPIRSWKEAGLPTSLVKAIDRAGYEKPSPIQMASIPLGLRQRDVIGIAETGSGKTAAFVLPMLVYLMKQPRMKGHPDIEAEGPYAVVLAPTRELTQQIEEETKKLAGYTEFRVVSVVGGQSIEEQGFALRRGCEIVVATPGRLNDCINRQYAVLNQCNYVVLDEADRMIEIGFEAQVIQVLEAMPSSNLKPEKEEEEDTHKVYRTTYMFSATMPPAVERLAKTFLRRPVIVTIGNVGRAAGTVSQRVVWLKENEKEAALAQELEQLESGPQEKRVIVFVNTKKHCDTVFSVIFHTLGYGTKVTMLHGGKSQDQREESIRGFRDGMYTILVATDVAGRGIDVPDVALVINYDMPNTIDAYTHRIGRTGRAGKKGAAVTFLTAGDTEVMFDLKKFLESSNAHVPRELASHEASRAKQSGAGALKNILT